MIKKYEGYEYKLQTTVISIKHKHGEIQNF